MRRREFVKVFAAASVSAKTLLGQQSATQVAPSAPPPAPVAGTAAARIAAPTAPGPVPWMRGLMESKPLSMVPLVPDAVADTKAHFFTDAQLATLRQLSEVLLPPMRGFPGAIDAGAPEFLDFLIGVSPPDRQEMYRAGLDRLDHEAKSKFGVPFAGVNAAQADVLIRPWLRKWMQDHPPEEPYARFINMAHADIRTATLNSKVYNDATQTAEDRETTAGLYWYPVEPDLTREQAGSANRLMTKTGNA